MTLRDKVESRMKVLGLNPNQLSKRMGLTGNGSIWSLLSGRTKTFRNISSLASALETTPDWLVTDDDTSSQPGVANSNRFTSLKDHKDSINMIRHSTLDGVFGEDTVPILGHANGSSDAIMINFHNEIGQAARHPNLKGIKDGFALYAAGDSMSPRYKSGELIYVACKRPPLPGQDCVVEMQDGVGFVKEFSKRTAKEIVCMQYNPEKEWRRLLSDVKAVHAVVGRG